MSPHRQLSTSSHRHPSEIQDIFLGLGLQLHDDPPPEGTSSTPDEQRQDARDMEYSMVLHDGTGVIESETYHYAFPGKGAGKEELNDASIRFSRVVLERILELQRVKSMDVRVVAGAQPIPEELQASKGIEWMASVWLHLDAIPFVISPATTMFKRLPTPDTQASASSAISAAIKYLHPATTSATVADTSSIDHEVLVDCDGKVRLCSLLQYEQSSSKEGREKGALMDLTELETLWSRFTSLSRHLLAQKSSVLAATSSSSEVGNGRLRVAFFSATPQGGGVALMRHALIRLWRMVGLDVKWYVPEGHPVIFDITKRKIHNVLQGVAPEGIEMTDEDKRFFEIWTEENYEAFWKDGATDADVVVIDDPQLTALIPIIRKKRPEAKIIFRSHIQIQANLTDDSSTPQFRTWNYLFDFVKDTDLFLAHPVRQFVPKNVKEKLPVLYMPPSSDPLDGLNKPYGEASIQYFRQYFNSLASKQGGNTIDWDRGYICQVARFDPSKGIDHLLEAYLQFRQKLQDMDEPPKDGGPQLIVMGHGSVDDPDGTVILEKCHDIISSEEYHLVRKDVAIVRAPPSDSVLGCIMQGAWVATQLSTREGFEVKVTEVVNKRVPIIVSDAGGIPLQVKNGINGFIVPTGDSQAVSDLLFDIYTGEKSISRGPLPKNRTLHGQDDPNSAAEAFTRDVEQPMPPIRMPTDEGSTSEDFWTVGNAVKWMYLISRVLGLKPEYAEDIKGDVDRVMGDAEGLGEGKEGKERIRGEAHWKEVLKRDEQVLRKMKVGLGKWDEEEEDNVWKLVMRDDLADGEGVVRDHQ